MSIPFLPPLMQYRTALRQGARLVSGAAVATMLAACALPNVPPGASVAEAQAAYGKPKMTCPIAGGGERLIWSQQPMGQYAWATNVGPDGRTDGVKPILIDSHFEVLREGVWTPDRVRCEFGPPAEIDAVGLPSVRQVVWAYRYRQFNSWNSLMYVYMGPNGDQVTRFHPGPDPLWDDRSDWSNN